MTENAGFISTTELVISPKRHRLLDLQGVQRKLQSLQHTASNVPYVFN